MLGGLAKLDDCHSPAGPGDCRGRVPRPNHSGFTAPSQGPAPGQGERRLAMKTRKLGKVGVGRAGIAALSASGCSSDHIEAINLANEGDQMVKVNVEGAISKYEQATQLDPSNHRITWKLANAYEKKEDWDKL